MVRRRSRGLARCVVAPTLLRKNQMEHHKLSKRDQQDSEDPGIETDPLPHRAHQEVDLDEDDEDDLEEARLSSDDLMALDEDDLVYAEGPDA
jgi:hypothetical protein